MQTWHLGYHAAQADVALFDLSDRTEITLMGKDRLTFLHGFCTNEIKKLGQGEGCEAFIPTIKGKTLGHIFVFHENESLVLDSVPAADQALMPHLDRYLITEDVKILSTHGQRQLFFLTGPNTLSQLEQLSPGLGTIGVLKSRQIEHRNTVITFRRVDWFNQPGVLISIPSQTGLSEIDLPSQLALPLASKAAWNALRIEATFPLFDVDFTADNLAQELDRTDRAISFYKGCYLGQEPIARIDALGHVNRLFRQLEIHNEQIQAEQLLGQLIFPADGGEKAIGEITSSTQIPSSDHSTSKILALAFIRREHAAEETPVAIQVAGNLIPAKVFSRRQS